MFKDKILMITGGTGSFGNTVLKRFFSTEAKSLTITDLNMTRFLMPLEKSVGLAQALKALFKKDKPISIIGTRHGGNPHESLVSREKMAKAEDLGSYCRIPADNRDLNYARYFSEGEKRISLPDDHTSHNTERLNVGQIKALSLKPDLIRGELHA